MRFAFLTIFSLAFVTSARGAEAKTVLHVPLFVEIQGGVQPNPTYDYVPVSEMNSKLVAKGQSKQTEFVDLTVDSKIDAFAIKETLDNALTAAGIANAQAAGELVPASIGKGAVKTCYRGDGNGVIDIVLANTDNLYSDQFTLIGWKLGSKTTYGDGWDSTDKEATSGLNEQSKLWKYYSKKSDAVVILASVGDDGTDVQESYIPRCK